MTFLWILLGIVYVVCWVYFGLATFGKGHYWMFWIGFIFPFLWIIGALISPTERALNVPPARRRRVPAQKTSEPRRTHERPLLQLEDRQGE